MKISILMSVYNPNWDYLQCSLESIEKQTFRDYELVIVNDGCDEKRLNSLLNTMTCERRIVINPTNLGLPKSLNRGLEECRGEYIARMDDDDVMSPDRLEKQLNYMENNKSVVAVFSNCRYIDEIGKTIKKDTGDRNAKLRNWLVSRGNCLVHSSLFARKSSLEEINGYDEKMTYSQDYDLYLRLLEKGELYIIPEILVSFRMDQNRIPFSKHILSILFSYYATIKYLSNNPSGFVFFLRTLVVGRQLNNVLKLNRNGK